MSVKMLSNTLLWFTQCQLLSGIYSKGTACGICREENETGNSLSSPWLLDERQVATGQHYVAILDPRCTFNSVLGWTLSSIFTVYDMYKDLLSYPYAKPIDPAHLYRKGAAQCLKWASPTHPAL